MADIDELKKLTPEERIKQLKAIESERKKEIEEAEALIRDSIRELDEATEKKHAPIRQVTADDISQLLTVEEKRMFRTARFQEGETKEETPEQQKQNLEEVAEEEAKQAPKNDHKPLYGQAIEEARKGIDYSSKMTTTGQDTSGGQGIGEMYSSKSVTGEDGPQSMYGQQSVEERTSGMYGKKEEEKKKRVELW